LFKKTPVIIQLANNRVENNDFSIIISNSTNNIESSYKYNSPK